MTPFTAYKNAFTGKAHQTKQGCLREEFHCLRRDVIACCDALLLVPSISLDVQFKRLLRKVRVLFDKGVEYHEACLHEKQISDNNSNIFNVPDNGLTLREALLIKRAAGKPLTRYQQDWLLSVVIELIEGNEQIVIDSQEKTEEIIQDLSAKG